MTLKELIKEHQKEKLEPETVRALMPDLTESDYNFIFAILTLIDSDLPFKDFFIFEKTVQTLNGFVPSFAKFDTSSPEEIWHAVKVMKKFVDKEFSKEVFEYVKYVFNLEGIYFYPEEFSFEEGKDVLEAAKKLAASGKKLTDETFLERQAFKYLTLELYHKIKTETVLA